MKDTGASNTMTFTTAELTGANYFLIGFMGSGKTHWGKKWAAISKLSFVDLDEKIEREANQTISEIFETAGEVGFRELEAKALRSCIHLQNTIVACGGGTPCFYENMQWMNEHGVTVYIDTTPEEILSRLSSEQDKRPLVSKLNQTELLIFIGQKIKEREPVYLRAKRVLQSSRVTEDSFKEIISSHHTI